MIKENLKIINDKISRACKFAGRSVEDVTLVAVSKKQEVIKIQEALNLDICNFGENYVQEFLQKKEILKQEKLSWHFIGPLQSNKAKKIVGEVELIHSVHKLALAKTLSDLSLKNEKDNIQRILLQVNLSGETSKSGFTEEDLLCQLDEIQANKGIQISGLMTMPPLYKQAEESRITFNKAFELSQKLCSRLSGIHNMDQLSMGTSQDFEAAILEGATIVRLGTILLGARSDKDL
ncbi:MAG: YggS family pyridoxal phosphate-dependent enzyme [Bdellovibrionaceae bacterium]|nr:YggS family pyridoxal phosphate-dependent enzyme [Pseudobdellovibrionaceae bacterium]